VQIYKPQDIYNVDIHPDFLSHSIHGVCKTNSQQVTEVSMELKQTHSDQFFSVKFIVPI
jgi:hypothetical protein